ncbi:MAG: FHA domain-containing protein [Thermoanaerobaculia bacterium]
MTAAAPLTVGSGAACGLRIQAAGVEEEHAIVRLDGDRVVLQSKVPGEGDARVNGVAVHAVSLQNGDAVRFGNVEATFEMGGGTAKLRLPDASHDLVRGVNAIGRDPGTGVVLNDESVSRKHAAIFILPSGQVVLRDLGSANGTAVKGRRLGEIELAAGDEIRIGDAVLHLRRQEAAPAAAPATGMAGAAAAKTVVGARPPAAVTPAASAPAGPKLELEFQGAKRVLHEGTVLIGRAPDCQLIIDDDALVSRHHAELRITGGQAMLRDLGSSNGTRINGAAISGERPLQDGDRIGIGKQELVFSADVPVTPFGQTMVARELPGAGGRTMVAPHAGGAAGRAAAPGGAGILPTDRESALLTLDLANDASEDQVQRRYRELYSEFQIRLTNAPTQDLKGTYERRLNELRAAAGILLPRSAAGSRDLPALEPIAAGPEAGAATAGKEEPAMAAAQAPGGSAASAVPPAAAVAAAAKSGAGKKSLPRSTVIMAVANVLLIGAAIFCALGAMRAGKVATELQAERDTKQEDFQRVEAAIPETTAVVESLSQTKGALLSNADLKICNHSSRSLEWVWLNTAWFDEEAGKFRSFDTALDTNYEYLMYEKIEPGATFSGGQWVVGEQRIWPGQAIFFAALFTYGGQDVLLAGATPTLGGNCFPLNLDR